MRKIAKQLLNKYQEARFHSGHNKSAMAVLKSIEAVNGKTDPKLLKLADAYASDILGWKGYAPWLYVYSAINQTFKEGWIPDNYYGEIVVPKLKGKYGTIAFYNALTGRLFDSSSFPVSAYFVNGLWISPEYQILSNKEVMEIVHAASEKVVYKLDSSLQGKGVYFIEKNALNIEKLKLLGNGVLQKYIKQHSFFQDIVPNSVATLRITSVIDDNGLVSVRACYLRVGRSADTHVMSSSHIRISVDLSTGLLDKFGYTTGWIQTESHPDTNFVFGNKQIPNFKECIETAINLHKMVPFARAIGWDMIVDVNNDVQVMEWNGNHNDIKFSEATQGPCFSDLGWEKLRKKV